MMRSLKVYSVLAYITSLIVMVCGIGISTYYIDNLAIRGAAVFALILMGIFTANIRRLVFKIEE